MNQDLQLIYKWYNINNRDLPWRNTTDPYKIWISEIILQQTRVEQGLSYYSSFIRTFPDVDALASASEDLVLKQWQGLGYYSRARNLHASAKIIQQKYHSRFPESYTDILSLKGIGPYTAAAIASIAFGLPYPVLDGNVYRFLARYHGISLPTNTSAGKKQFEEAAIEMMPEENPGFHNEALMEFGALMCTPRNPGCTHCPVSSSCYAFSKGMTQNLPVAKKQLTRRNRYLCYYMIDNDKSIWLEKRTSDDIWKNLYQLPAAEFKNEISEEEAARHQPDFLKGINYNIKSISPVLKHVLSHQTLNARLVHVETMSRLKFPPPYVEIAKSDFYKYPVPRLIEKLLGKIKNGLKLN